MIESSTSYSINPYFTVFILFVLLCCFKEHIAGIRLAFLFSITLVHEADL